jgi:hypothetical protein
MTSTLDPCQIDIVEPVAGSDIPVHLMYVETWDGLYTPIGIRKPQGDGPFPIVLLASGNGGGGMAWIRDAVDNRGYIMERLLEAGYACAWLRYRTEVELGYHEGGPLIRDMRQGRGLFNRSPLEYEDEIAIIDFVKTLPWVDPDRIGLIGMRHGGEMVLKITSQHRDPAPQHRRHADDGASQGHGTHRPRGGPGSMPRDHDTDPRDGSEGRSPPRDLRCLVSATRRHGKACDLGLL